MEQLRELPNLNLEEPYFLSVKGGFFLALSVFPALLGLLFVSGWVEIRGTEVERAICGTGVVLVFVPLGLWQAGMVVREMLRERRRLAQKRRWLESASTMQAAIVDRKEEHNGYAETREEQWINELAFKIPSMPGEARNEMVVWARVNNGVFEMYRLQDSARLFYSKNNPCQFLIEGE